MWLLFAFSSAILLGFYDVSKKRSLHDNAVIPVLLINTFVMSMIFLPAVLFSIGGYIPSSSMLYVEQVPWKVHGYVFLKSLIVLSSWMLGYFAIKHLPLTIVGPINATRPVMVLLGALLVFGERLNTCQWMGVILSIVSFFLLSRTGKKEGVHFSKNKWVMFLILAAIFGAVSGLYDKYLIGSQHIPPMVVQSWYNFYQFIEMALVTAFLWYPSRQNTTPFEWRWSILFIPVLLSLADFAYFYALTFEDSLIAVVSMVRRGSVLVSFACGAFFLHEKNLRNKAFDLLLVLLGLVFLYIGSR